MNMAIPLNACATSVLYPAVTSAVRRSAMPKHLPGLHIRQYLQDVLSVLQRQRCCNEHGCSHFECTRYMCAAPSCDLYSVVQCSAVQRSAVQRSAAKCWTGFALDPECVADNTDNNISYAECLLQCNCSRY